MVTRVSEFLATTRGRVVAGAAAAAVAIAVLAWATTPRSSGVDDQWEAPAFAGSVLDGRALVAESNNKALDLVTGKTITIGSVTGGQRFVAGNRLLIVNADRVDGAALNAQQRWTWTAPAGASDLGLVASSRTGTIARYCTAPDQCLLAGIGPSGTTAWTLPEPPSVTGEAVAAPDGGLPTYGLLPCGESTWLLVDPMTSRMVLRVADDVDVAPDGVVTLEEKLADGRCTVTTGESLDRLGSAAQTCSTRPVSHDRLRDGEVLTASEDRLWWWPFTTVRTVELSGQRHFTLISSSPLTVLRLDEEGVTVRDGDCVVRFRIAGT